MRPFTMEGQNMDRKITDLVLVIVGLILTTFATSGMMGAVGIAAALVGVYGMWTRNQDFFS